MVISSNSVVVKQVKNASKINKDNLASIAVMKNRIIIIDLNRQQMRLGINSQGNLFAPYSINYWNFKRTLPTYRASDGVADLFLSGSFQKNMELSAQGKTYNIKSDVPYAEKLSRKYPKAFGLSENYMPKAKEIITKDYNELYHKALNK